MGRGEYQGKEIQLRAVRPVLLASEMLRSSIRFPSDLFNSPNPPCLTNRVVSCALHTIRGDWSTACVGLLKLDVPSTKQVGEK